MKTRLGVVALVVLATSAGCKKDSRDSGKAAAEVQPTPTCEEVCEHLVGCQASREGVGSNTVMAHEARQMCEYQCPRHWQDEERRCWMETTCSDIPENPMDSEKCPKYAEKVEAERKAEKEAERQACEPKIEKLMGVIAEGEKVELTNPVLEGLRCVTTTLDVPNQYPSLDDLFPDLKEKLATARDDFERDEFRTQFEKANAAAIKVKREEWGKRREATLATLRAATGAMIMDKRGTRTPTYWIEARRTYKRPSGVDRVYIRHFIRPGPRAPLTLRALGTATVSALAGSRTS